MKLFTLDDKILNMTHIPFHSQASVYVCMHMCVCVCVCTSWRMAQMASYTKKKRQALTLILQIFILQKSNCAKMVEMPSCSQVLSFPVSCFHCTARISGELVNWTWERSTPLILKRENHWAAEPFQCAEISAL